MPMASSCGKYDNIKQNKKPNNVSCLEFAILLDAILWRGVTDTVICGYKGKHLEYNQKLYLFRKMAVFL